MRKPHLIYHVTLTDEERKTLKNLVRKGNTAGYRMRHAQLLLALDEIPENDHWTDATIAQAYGVHVRSISTLRKQFVEEGFEAAVERKKRATPPRVKVDGKAEAYIVALACSEPPQGRSRWTLQVLADKVVELGVLESISATAIGTTLKKTKLSPGSIKSGA